MTWPQGRSKWKWLKDSEFEILLQIYEYSKIAKKAKYSKCERLYDLQKFDICMGWAQGITD